MIEELPDDIDNDELDDVEPVGDEAQLYEPVSYTHLDVYKRQGYQAATGITSTLRAIPER